MSDIFEIVMVVCFGFSWPMSLMKSYKSQTTKGKSLFFLVLIDIGYIFGITSKLISTSYKWYVLFFYVLNFFMVSADIVLYFRNKKFDKERERL